MPSSMPPKKNRIKHKNAAPPTTQTEEQTVVAKPSTENDAPSQNPLSEDSKSDGQMSEEDIRQSTMAQWLFYLHQELNKSKIQQIYSSSVIHVTYM